MGYGEARGEEYRLLRAADAAVALVLCGATEDECGDLVLVRLLATMLDASGYGTCDPAGMLGAADVALLDAWTALSQAATAGDELRVRSVLHAALRAAADYDYGLEFDYELEDVPPLRLDPFSRRLRLLMRNLGVTGADAARALGVRPHQVHHWTSGDSKPEHKHRVALADLLGVHPRWFAAPRDSVVDACLYQFHDCPCRAGADLRLGPLDDVSGFPGSGRGLWCCGCGQPYVLSAGGWLYPVPASDDSSRGVLTFPAVGVDNANMGGELERPWPHALWVEQPDPQRVGGPFRRPPMLQSPPWDPVRGNAP